MMMAKSVVFVPVSKEGDELDRATLWIDGYFNPSSDWLGWNNCNEGEIRMECLPKGTHYIRVLMED